MLVSPRGAVTKWFGTTSNVSGCPGRVVKKPFCRDTWGVVWDNQLQAREAPIQKWQNSSGVKSLPIQGGDADHLMESHSNSVDHLTPQLRDTVCALSTLQMLSSNWEGPTTLAPRTTPSISRPSPSLLSTITCPPLRSRLAFVQTRLNSSIDTMIFHLLSGRVQAAANNSVNAGRSSRKRSDTITRRQKRTAPLYFTTPALHEPRVKKMWESPSRHQQAWLPTRPSFSWTSAEHWSPQ